MFNARIPKKESIYILLTTHFYLEILVGHVGVLLCRLVARDDEKALGILQHVLHGLLEGDRSLCDFPGMSSVVDMKPQVMIREETPQHHVAPAVVGLKVPEPDEKALLPLLEVLVGLEEYVELGIGVERDVCFQREAWHLEQTLKYKDRSDQKP
jgi:hypothetical protein